MKNLRCISTAVLACLVLAAPASAADEVHLILSPTSTTLGGTPITATASGVATSNYAVWTMRTEGACTEANAMSSPFGRNHFAGAFEQAGVISPTRYPTVGTYKVCAEIDEWAETSEATFAVLAVPPPPPPPGVNNAPPPPPPVVTAPPPVVKPLTAAQKLKAALAKCKHQKNKRKRVKCERAARASAKHR